MAYVQFPYDQEDPDAVLAAILVRIAERIPGWTPRETHLEYAVLSEMVRIALETRLLAADVADAIFRSIGGLFGLPADDGTPASAQAVFVLSDTTGGTVPAGTLLQWAGPTDTFTFTTGEDAVAPAGSDTTGPVTVTATEPGAAANGLGTGGLSLVDSLAGVDDVQPMTLSDGGTDAETDAAYLDRLAELFTVVRPAPVLVGDFAVLAKRTPGVFRALALDGGERTVKVIPLDAAGRTPAPAVVTAMQQNLDDAREVGFDVQTATPTYTAVRVVATVSFTGELDQAGVLQAVRQAALDYLSPAAWGGGDTSPPRWEQTSRVRYLEVGALLDAVPGVLHVESLLINGGTTDLLLPGAAPLPARPDDPTDPTTVSVEAAA